jgi:signal peptidase II
MFESLGAYLKWIQAALVVVILYVIFSEGYLKRYAFPAGLLIGGALGNVYDRFVHEGVVDYVAWHCGFDFAVFNFADVAIDVAVVIVLVMMYFFPEKEKQVDK